MRRPSAPTAPMHSVNGVSPLCSGRLHPCPRLGGDAGRSVGYFSKQYSELGPPQPLLTPVPLVQEPVVLLASPDPPRV